VRVTTTDITAVTSI